MSKETLHQNPDMVHEKVYNAEAKALFGFWAYLMSDCLLFASLFAAYAVLHTSTYGGPSSKELFHLPFVLMETFILLASTFTYGLVSLYARHQGNIKKVLVWLVVTFILGAGFLGMEIYEFHTLIQEGNGPGKSAFLSAFFTLVGTHGIHILVGLVWMANLFVQLVRFGVTSDTLRKMSVLGLFWHFLDIIWIFIFSVVYLMGAL